MKKLIFILASVFVACGSPQEETTKPKETNVEQNKSVSNSVVLRAGDDMKFDKTKFTVQAGEEVTLTFANEGVLPIETMGHNVVILEKGTDVAQFANASAKAKETGYISELYITDIIAQTKLLGPGESETIRFKLKEAGDYTFICTFPGHWVAMKGTITAVN